MKTISSIPKRFLIKLSNLKSKFSSQIASNKKRIKNKTSTHEYKQKVNAVIHYVLDFCFVVIIYGVMLNYVVHQLIGLDFSIRLVVAWGLVSYILKSEVPEVIQKCKIPNMIFKK